MSELVNLKIDGKPVSVPKGTNVLEAAQKIGIEVSYFCYHPGLSSPAVCRQCLVDVKGQPKPVPSCYTPVAENMEVDTSSAKVLEVRAKMLEFTLKNHPVDCPICDKAGECHLQKQYDDWDSAPSRVDVAKIRKPKMVDLGPEIVLDAERCILCTRCIRVCDEVAGEHQLEMAFRGDREQLTTAPGHKLDNPYSINTVDVCPVGALTAKDFRFQMRAWELYTTPSVCAGCATGCNTEIQAKDKVYRLIPRENQEVNKFWMCDEGRFTYHELYEDRTAGARVNGTPAMLERATHAAAEKILALKNAGALKSLGIVLNAQATNEDNYLFMKVAKALGVEKVYVSGRPDKPEREDKILRSRDVNPNTTGAKAVAEWGVPGRVKSSRDIAADINAGNLKALWILGDYLDLEDLSLLQKLEWTIYQSPHDTNLADKMSIVLPAAAWAEQHGTFTNGKGFVQRIRAAVEPPGDARPHRELIEMIANKIGVPVLFPTVKALFFDMKQSVPAFGNAEFGREMLPIQLRFAGSRG